MHFCCELAKVVVVWHCLGLLSNITLLPRCRLTASPAAHSHTRARSHPCHSSLLFATSGFSVIGQLKYLHSWLTQTLQKLLNIEKSQRHCDTDDKSRELVVKYIEYIWMRLKRVLRCSVKYSSKMDKSLKKYPA